MLYLENHEKDIREKNSFMEKSFGSQEQGKENLFFFEKEIYQKQVY